MDVATAPKKGADLVCAWWLIKIQVQPRRVLAQGAPKRGHLVLVRDPALDVSEDVLAHSEPDGELALGEVAPTSGKEEAFSERRGGVKQCRSSFSSSPPSQ